MSVLLTGAQDEQTRIVVAKRRFVSRLGGFRWARRRVRHRRGGQRRDRCLRGYDTGVGQGGCERRLARIRANSSR